MRRPPLDNMLVRAPALAGALANGMNRMPAGSPARRHLMSHQVKRAFEAMARSDADVVLLSYEPDAEVRMHGMEAVGVSGLYRGHDGIRALYAEIDDVFADWRWTVRQIVDGGERFAIRADFLAHGRGSGAETTVRDSGTAVRLSARGLVERQDWYAQSGSWPRVLAAAGLPV